MLLQTPHSINAQDPLYSEEHLDTYASTVSIILSITSVGDIGVYVSSIVQIWQSPSIVVMILRSGSQLTHNGSIEVLP